VSWLFVVLLAAAVLAVIGAEWPRFAERRSSLSMRRRPGSGRRGHLRVVTSDDDDDISADEFAASVQRDLSALPTIEERDRR
jgi:hypothetical protein